MSAGADLRLLRAAVFAAVCVTLSAAGHIFASGPGVPLLSLVLGFVAVLALAVPLAGRERSLPGIAALLTLGQLTLHVLFSGGQQHAAGTGASGGGGTADGRSGVVALAGKLLCDDSAMGMTEAEAHRVVSDAGLSSAGAATDTAAQGSAHAGHLGHAGSTGTMPFPDTPLDCLRGAARAALGFLDGQMLLSHLVAALVLGLLLRRGEAALWRLVRLSAEVAATADEVVAARALRAAMAYVRAFQAGLLPDAPVRVVFHGTREEIAPLSVVLQHSVHRRGPPGLRAETAAVPVPAAPVTSALPSVAAAVPADSYAADTRAADSFALAA